MGGDSMFVRKRRAEGVSSYQVHNDFFQMVYIDEIVKKGKQ